MHSLHLKEITKTQIDKMDPCEIHELFKAFAGEFFNKLYLYGSLGFVFGINIYLSILLTIAAVLEYKRRNTLPLFRFAQHDIRNAR